MDYKILSLMKKLLLLFPVTIFLLASCEEDADIELPEVEPKIVISCFITPQDSIIRAYISRSNPVFNSSTSTTGAAVPNATVMLYGNSSSVQLVYNSITEYYEVSTAVFPVLAGNEYRIDVTHAASGAHAEATTTVPLVTPSGFQCTATDTIVSSDPWNTYGESRFEYSFQDPAGQQNLYRFTVYNVMYDSVMMDTSLNQWSSWDLFNDENADGTAISRNFISWYNEYAGSLIEYDVWLHNCNYDYYMFHQSMNNYDGGDNPFAEPVQIYTNVTDGLGIFAAANAVHLRIPR
jgi:hypothetical protein